MFTKFNKNLQILDFMPYKQRVTGSNPVAPTPEDQEVVSNFNRLCAIESKPASISTLSFPRSINR